MTSSTPDIASTTGSASAGRRGFLRIAGPIGLAMIAGCARPDPTAVATSPLERIALRQAIIERIMVIYDEIALRLDRDAELPVEALAESSTVIVDGTTALQRIEEELIFPRVEKAAPAGLLPALRCQHAVAARMAAEILRAARAGGMSSSGERVAAAAQLRSFTRMYRAHLAREGTIIQPLLHTSLDAAGAARLAGELERREADEQGAGRGVERMLTTADQVERMLGISDISFYSAGACE